MIPYGRQSIDQTDIAAVVDNSIDLFMTQMILQEAKSFLQKIGK